MKVEIVIPSMGESVSEATIAAILKENGSQVAMDEEILELETDKVNQVLVAPKAGRLEITVSVDDTVTIGQVIGHVDTEAAGEAPPAPKKEEPPAPEAAPEEPKPVEVQQSHGGPGARYTPEQYVADLGKSEEKVAPPPAPKREPGEKRETRTRMSKIRQVIARRLVDAQHTTAMLTTFNEIDMSAVMDIRARHRDDFEKKHGVRLGFMSFFVKGVVAALDAVPGVNSYIDGNEIVHREYFDIGIAVGTDRGLMVPVVRDCDQLSFAGVEQSIKDYAGKARAGTISVDDLQGGGFTITNGGLYGSLLSTPILNPPQSGILGMHKIQQRPMVVDGQVVARPMMYTALSYDHRIVDGQEAVTFLVRLKQYLEDPATLMLSL